MRYLVLLIPVIVSTSLQAGSINKWVDDEGNVHYGDAPPVGAKTESVRVQSAPSNPGRALPRLNSQEGETGASDSTGATAATEPSDVPEDQAKVACDNAREDLKVISRSNRIKLRAADGTERYMTSEEIAERKDRAEADVERFCQ